MPIRPDSQENFLKAVYTLQEGDVRVSTNALAELLGITAPSVTDMARRMVSAGYVDYERYYGVRLTDEGRALALRVIRRHRLLELYLVRELGYALHEVHDEAENLEHAVSDHFIEALARKLGNPTVDPHGDPIPNTAGEMPRRDLHLLSQVAAHTPARVSRLTASSNEMLNYLLERGFALGASVEVQARDPFEGPVTVRVNGETRSIGHSVAACVWVELL